MRLEVKDVHKSFGDIEVLHGISFEVNSGSAFGLLGRNGAGKTTTIRILMDVFKANKGEILLDGKPFIPTDYKIGYLPEERGLYPKKSVCDQMVYLGRLRGLSVKEAKESTRFWLKRLGIEEYYNRKLETLSKGNQQKVQLAQTLVCNPDIVILDEPFSGLDPVNSQILKDVVTELIQAGKLVIFSSHQMSYVEEFCDNILIMNHGDVAISGNLKEIKKTFGENRLTISSLNYSLSELNDLLVKQLPGLVIQAQTKDSLILDLQAGLKKQDVLKACLELQIDIEKFAMYEPTLNDIFVWKAGDDK